MRSLFCKNNAQTKIEVDGNIIIGICLWAVANINEKIVL